MAEEKKDGVSVYISPRIVEVLERHHKKNRKVGIAARLDPLMTSESSIGSPVYSYLLMALGMHRNYEDEQQQAKQRYLALTNFSCT